jgi:hypothetical protein
MDVAVLSKQVAIRDDRLRSLEVTLQETQAQTRAIKGGMILGPSHSSSSGGGAAVILGGRVAKPIRGGAPPTPGTPNRAEE